ncbi:hypothetical protein OG474_37825 [Kribbella sp. NBC_01505]|uniref:hypothetical protein n=1 Tax=Kribbella sp. NBC_01505 TaxID=2903580 RepID=UPI00386C507F
MSNPTAPPRRFWLVQDEAGIVAEGILWSSGQVAVHWPGRPVGTSQWTSITDLLAVHAHEVEWIDTGRGRRRECAHAECVEYDNGAIWVH